MIQLTVPCPHDSGSHEIEFFEPVDARYYLGVHEVTMNRWRLEGYLRGHKVGRGYLYTQAQLDETLNLKKSFDERG